MGMGYLREGGRGNGILAWWVGLGWVGLNWIGEGQGQVRPETKDKHKGYDISGATEAVTLGGGLCGLWENGKKMTVHDKNRPAQCQHLLGLCLPHYMLTEGVAPSTCLSLIWKVPVLTIHRP